MTDQTPTATRIDGVLALGLSVFVLVANMAPSHIVHPTFWTRISLPLVLIAIPLGLYWLLKPNSRTAPPQTPDDDHSSPYPEWESAPRIIVGGGMTNQNTAASWMRTTGACALVAAVLVFMANVGMDRSPTVDRALLAGVSHPLVLISIALGLFLLLRPKSRTATPRTQDEGFPVLEPPPPLPSKPDVSRSDKP